MSDEAKFRIKANTWVLPQAEACPIPDKQYQVGDLVEVGSRLCLVLASTDNEEPLQKRVLVQWLGEKDTYWINYNTFIELSGGNNG